MPKTRLLAAGVLLLAAGLVGGAALLPAALAQDKTGNDEAALTARIDKRVRAWQPTPEERRLDDIAWAKDIRDARRLAQQHARPIFLFTYSGCAEREHAIALQRC
jgi:hypothetical protein